jgi:hypothetical protein
MALDTRCIDCCKELIGSIPDDERKQYSALLSYEDVPYIDELHEGLTYLAISCMELAVLFSKFESEENHEIVVQRMTIGYLFEVYNSLWDWIGKPTKNICEARNLPTDEYIVLKKGLDSYFSKYLPLLKAVRDGSFHTKETGDKDWINSATRLLFRTKVPQKLRRYLYEYGYEINVATFKKGIYGCYPGIGGFAAIHPSGTVTPMVDLYYAGTPIKITPASVP